MSLPEGTFSSSAGDLDFGQEVTLGEKLKVFKTSGFDPEDYVSTKCRTTSEKEIKQLVTCLLDLKKASAEEMRKSVYANYPSFIRTSREISDLEGQLVALRNLLNNRATIIQTLADGSRVESMSSGPGSRKKDSSDTEGREPSEKEVWLSQYTENLHILLAERRVDEALVALDEGERVAKEEKSAGSMTALMLSSLQATIIDQRQKLADQLAVSACQPSSSGIELRSAVETIKQLGDGPRAHTLLLNSHHQKLESKIQGLQTSGSTYGVAYTAALSQLVFSIIAQASSDSLAIFGDQPLYTSELVTWSVKQTDAFAHLMKRRVIASPSASGGLRTVAECVQISMGHCYLLEARGLALAPVLLRHFRPCIEQALNANLKRIEQSTAALAAADDWSLNFSPVGSRSLGSTASLGSLVTSQPKLSSSAHRFHVMVQEMCEDIGLLRSLQFSRQAMEGLVQVFNSYVHMLVNALPGSSDTENLEGRIVRKAEDEAQQIALLANALLLSDELLPRAAIKLLPLQHSLPTETPRKASDRQLRTPEQRELKKRLQRFVDQLRDSFCREHALELIFTEDGSARINAQMYLSMDENSEEPEWFPSTVFQELFVKLNTLAILASDMFVGRERFTTLLLIRLTETITLWLSDEQSFWEAIEHGSKPLGPFGLRQFYLDMQFVILFASQGRYLSRNLHQVIKNIISRVMDSVAAANIDPNSTLPEDQWFVDVAQTAIKMLNGNATIENVEATSPTASMPARSLSSVSHE
ncbi:exocyst complex component EXO84A-like [Cynara cardunculus var. scolymus]|uniref:exocyst complex component EXO84A-like n=1 Tax=Cynara cardunculus var. scolymus TaxID=59895 RepID=UPI000D62438F|nr:exocyst complex component EXO84A-like [Cynara cardunculus var. scolymus]